MDFDTFDTDFWSEIQDLDRVHTILDKNIIGLENLVKKRIESEEDECDSLISGTGGT